MRRAALILSLLFCLAAPARAGDDIQAITALWSDFVSAVRRGDYARAHGLFSAESRTAMPYADFVREYGPLSLAREMVLAKPESMSTSLNGDWAELTYGGYRPGTGRQFKVGVGMTKNLGAWGLVAARNEEPERIEAAVRSFLATAAGLRGLPNAGQLLSDMISQANNPALTRYRFDSDGRTLKAVPLAKGLRSFHVDEWGQVRPGEFAGRSVPPPDCPVPDQAPDKPAPSALLRELGPIPGLNEKPPLPLPPAAPPAAVNGLPELREPPMIPLSGAAGRDELPELAPPPPLPAASSRTVVRIPEPEKQFHLPDVIE